MVGSIISGASGLASGIFGGIMAGKERKRAAAALNAEKQFNDGMFNKEYYSNPLERSDNAALLAKLKTMLDAQTKRAGATAAVMGSTPEAVAAAKEQANNTLAGAAGNIAERNASYKDNVMSRYMTQRNNLYNQQQNMSAQNAQSWSNMMQNGLNTLTSSAASIGNSLLNKPQTVSPKQVASYGQASSQASLKKMDGLTKGWKAPVNFGG